MTTQREPSVLPRRPRRLLAVGLGSIAMATAVSLYSHLSPTGKAWAHYRAGAKLSCCGEPDPVAIKHFWTALRLDPRLFEARRGLAAIYVNLDRKGDAERLYKERAVERSVASMGDNRPPLPGRRARTAGVAPRGQEGAGSRRASSPMMDHHPPYRSAHQL